MWIKKPHEPNGETQLLIIVLYGRSCIFCSLSFRSAMTHCYCSGSFLLFLFTDEKKKNKSTVIHCRSSFLHTKSSRFYAFSDSFTILIAAKISSIGTSNPVSSLYAYRAFPFLSKMMIPPLKIKMINNERMAILLDGYNRQVINYLVSTLLLSYFHLYSYLSFFSSLLEGLSIFWTDSMISVTIFVSPRLCRMFFYASKKKCVYFESPKSFILQVK